MIDTPRQFIFYVFRIQIKIMDYIEGEELRSRAKTCSKRPFSYIGLIILNECRTEDDIRNIIANGQLMNKQIRSFKRISKSDTIRFEVKSEDKYPSVYVHRADYQRLKISVAKPPLPKIFTNANTNLQRLKKPSVKRINQASVMTTYTDRRFPSAISLRVFSLQYSYKTSQALQLLVLGSEKTTCQWDKCLQDEDAQIVEW